MLREIKAALEVNSPHRISVTEVHLETVALVLARQAIGKWRLFWPWAVWVTAFGVMGKIGYGVANYFSAENRFDYRIFVFEVDGVDPVSLVLLVFLIFLYLPTVFIYYRRMLVERAEIAINFYHRGVAWEPQTSWLNSLDGEIWAGEKTSKNKFIRLIGGIVKSVAPGILASTLGVLAGYVVAFRRIEFDERMAVGSMLAPSLSVIIFLLALSFTITSLAVIDAHLDLRQHSFPPRHPQGLVVKPSEIGYM